MDARREYLTRESANFGSSRKLTLELGWELRLPQPRTWSLGWLGKLKEVQWLPS